MTAMSFDGQLWLDQFTSLGGLYALGADRTLNFVSHGPCLPELNLLVGRLVDQPTRQEAVREAIEARQMVEVCHAA